MSQPRHRHDTAHTGLIPVSQLASGVPVSGQVPTYSGVLNAAWGYAGGWTPMPSLASANGQVLTVSPQSGSLDWETPASYGPANPYFTGFIPGALTLGTSNTDTTGRKFDWTAWKTTGSATITMTSSASWPSGIYALMAFAAVGTAATNNAALTSDLFLIPAADTAHPRLIMSYNVPATVTLNFRVSLLFYDITETYISTVSVDSAIPGATSSGIAIFDSLGGYAVPLTARYARFEVIAWETVNHSASTYLDIGAALTPSIPLFVATNPSTQAFGDAAATGSSIAAARLDHKHGMMANPWTAAIGSSLPAQPAYGNYIPFFYTAAGYNESYYYDGTRWLSTVNYFFAVPPSFDTNIGNLNYYTADQAYAYECTLPTESILLDLSHFGAYDTSANNNPMYWAMNASLNGANIGYGTDLNLSRNTWVAMTASVAPVVAAAGFKQLTLAVNHYNSAAGCYFHPSISYRKIAT